MLAFQCDAWSCVYPTALARLPRNYLVTGGTHPLIWIQCEFSVHGGLSIIRTPNYLMIDAKPNTKFTGNESRGLIQ